MVLHLSLKGIKFLHIFSLAGANSVDLNQNALEKANLLLLTKHATEKDRSLKTQLLVANNSEVQKEEPAGEKIWVEQGFGDKKSDFGCIR